MTDENNRHAVGASRLSVGLGGTINGDVSMNIWKVLQEQAIEHHGKAIETTLLGNVLPIKTGSVELTGFIPPALQGEARTYGLIIEAALWKEGRYVLRTLPPNNRNEGLPKAVPLD